MPEYWDWADVAAMRLVAGNAGSSVAFAWSLIRWPRWNQMRQHFAAGIRYGAKVAQ